jgi:hypothetical protein
LLLSDRRIMMVSCLMDTSHDYLISNVHVPAEHAPYYIEWVRQAYEMGSAGVRNHGGEAHHLSFQEWRTRNVAVTSASSSSSPLAALPTRGGVDFTKTFVGSVGYSHSMVAGGLLVMS